jgi:hypothetical protein
MRKEHPRKSEIRAERDGCLAEIKTILHQSSDPLMIEANAALLARTEAEYAVALATDRKKLDALKELVRATIRHQAAQRALEAEVVAKGAEVRALRTHLLEIAPTVTMH